MRTTTIDFKNIRRLIYVLLLLAFPVNIGCASWKKNGTDDDNKASNSKIWDIKPVSMRIYPSTRFRMEGKTPILDLRVELFDDMGDSVKGVGRWRFDLWSISKTGDKIGAKPIYSWPASTQTLAENRAHYDPVTRTYRFQLRIDNIQVAGQPVMIVAHFNQPDQSHMENSMRLGLE